jgi:hypothetical protein
LSIPYLSFHFAAQARLAGGRVVASQPVAIDPMMERAERELEEVKTNLKKAENDREIALNALNQAKKQRKQFMSSHPDIAQV